MEILVVILAFVLIGGGLLGVFLPLLPGVPLAWLGLFIYALITGFETISIQTILIFLGLTVLTFLIDFIAPIIGAKHYEATKSGIAGAAIGFIFGIIVFGPVGVLLGPLAGAFLGEWFADKNSKRAIKAAIGIMIGFLVGSVIKAALIFTMLGFFIASLL